MNFFTIIFLCSSFALAGVAEPLVIWNHLAIKVCWGNKADLSRQTQVEDATEKDLNVLPESLKLQLKNKIQSEYTEKKTGIHFEGWLPCSQMSQPDVILFTSSTNGSMATLGQNGIYGISGYAQAQRDSNASVWLDWDPKRSLRHKLTLVESFLFTAVHEFGHLSGLRHEHVRSEHHQDKYCAGLEDTQETYDESTRVLTPYDPQSIMSYCYNQYVNENGLKKKSISLSPLDVETLSNLYKKTIPRRRRELTVNPSAFETL